MSKAGGPNFIDGFSSVQAVKRSNKTSTAARTRPSSSTLPALETPKAAEKPPEQPHAKRISRSAIPEKFSITCYECKYVFTLQGRVIDNFCPKCHEKLSAAGVTIDREWTSDVKTIGRVEIRKGAAFPARCRITARDLLLEADASGTDLNIYNKLELSQGAGFNVESTEIRTLVIAKDSSLALKGEVRCDSLEVLGTLRADIKAAKGVTVEEGGTFRGSIEAPSLVVRDGAALNARLRIGAGRK